MTAAGKLLRALRQGAYAAMRHLAETPFRESLAHPAYHDDLYVVSYPKSGATWMNFLMANLHLRASGDARAVTFFNVHDFVPDVNSGRDIGPTKLPFPGHRVIKSHAGFNPKYRKVVYVVRDPRAVMISYHHFLTALGQVSGSLSETIRDERFGITPWVQHVAGWYEQTDPATSFHTLRYEDLKKDPKSTLLLLYTELGHAPADIHLDEAVAASSFNHMKALEERYGYGGIEQAKKLTFMREGRSRSWPEEMSESDIAYIEERAGSWLDRFGYSRHATVSGN